MVYGLKQDDAMSVEHIAYGVQQAHQMLQVARECSSRGTAKKVIGEAVQKMSEATRSLNLILDKGKVGSTLDT